MLCKDTWIKLCAWLSLGMAPAVYFYFFKETNKKLGEHRCSKEIIIIKKKQLRKFVPTYFTK